mgnify:CR=1 FL=1
MEQHFTIVIPAYNVEQWAEKNVRSALAQKYDNFDVAYINDCSTDETDAVVSNTIDNLGDPENFHYEKNKINKKALENIYNEIVRSHRESIIITLDGDDWFPNHDVLARLNEIYTPDVWITAGSYIDNSNGLVSSPQINKGFWDGNIRRHAWTISHLRTFRRELFLKVNKEDMFDHDGNFYKCTFDQAMMYPMVEMAGPEHFCPIYDVLYVYNRENPISVDRVHRGEQLRIERDIRAKRPYDRLVGLE